MAKPPVDPADVWAAKNDPKSAIEEMSTLCLIAFMLTAEPEREIKGLDETEFGLRLRREKTANLVTDEWLVNARDRIVSQIAAEYISRVDATPQGVISLYRSAAGSSELIRRDIIGGIPLMPAKPDQGGKSRWFNPVTDLLSATDIATMYEVEKGIGDHIANRCKLVYHYSSFPGRQLPFMIKAVAENNWNSNSHDHEAVLASISELVPILSDDELRRHVSEASALSMLTILIGECRKRKSSDERITEMG